MLTWIVPVTKRPEVERDRFIEFWRGIHAPHVANLARPERYRITFFERAASLGGQRAEEMPYDGLAELSFRDPEHFDAGFGEARGGLPGLDGFGDLILPLSDGLFATENVIVDGPAGSELTKWVAFVKANEGVGRDELFAAWSGEHSPRVAASIAKAGGACSRYTTSHARASSAGRWDGIASLWYASEAAADAGLPPSEPGDPFPALIASSETVVLQGTEITVVG